MASNSNFNRREFLGMTAAASTISILPRHVFGGPGRVAPSDKLNFALIGSGTMGINMLIGTWLPHEELHISCVCDPNKKSNDYRDWSRNGIRNRVREFLQEPEWGDDDGILGGREVGKDIIETYYAKVREMEDYKGCTAYADFRELLEKESDIDGVLIMTPEHLHATISIAAMKKGKHAVSHKTLANVMHEVKLAADTARETGLVTHLMAWQNDAELHQLDAWLKAGIIGPVREVHNWSNRPVWPQGWLEAPPEQKVPKDFDWDLWLGPVPDRPYNINYTHNLFRGWYDFGSGCLGDMGNYSLWRVYRMLDLGTPTMAEGRSTTGCRIEDHVSRQVRSQVSYPHASTVQFHHPATDARPAVDVFWYDGGIKPATPPELYEDNELLPREGMLFIGDYGKILGDFHGRRARLLPASRMKAFEGMMANEEEEVIRAPQEWINAIKEGKESMGSYQNIQPLAEATCLGNLAVRLNQRLEYDSKNMKITNVEEANQYLRREYRPGWEL